MKTATAKDVHEECDKQAELLVKEAHSIVEKSKKKDYLIIQKLKKIGFGNSESIKKDEELLQKSKDALRCNLLYPQNNFLTEDAIRGICKKYGLLFAPANKFIGAIPERNQIEMASFKLADEDARVVVVDKEKFKTHKPAIKKLVKKMQSGDVFSNLIAGMFISAIKSNYILNMTRKEYNEKKNDNWSLRQEVMPEFMVIATPENIDMKNVEVIGDYKVVDKDPVVFCKVNSGWLQVSAWGHESSLDEFQTASKN